MLETWEARSPIRLALESYLVPESNGVVCYGGAGYGNFGA